MPLASEVYDMSRALLNDQVGSVYTDQILQPYLNIAIRDIGSLMNRSNIPVTNSTSAVIPFVEGRTQLAPGDADFPARLIEIQGVYQRQNDNQDFFLITRVEFLTPLQDNVESTYIPAWSYQENILNFIPASGDLQLRIDYVKNVVAPITTPSEDIDIINSLNYLGYRTSALASMYVGENETRAQTLNMQADMEWNQLEGVNTKGKQSIYTRRRPLRSRNWGGSALGW